MMKTTDRCVEAIITRPRESVAMPAGFSKNSVAFGSALPTILSTQDFFFLVSTSKLLLSACRNFTRGLSGGSGHISCALSVAGGWFLGLSAPARPGSVASASAIFNICIVFALVMAVYLVALSGASRWAASPAFVLLSVVVLPAHRPASAQLPSWHRHWPRGSHRIHPFFSCPPPRYAPAFRALRHGSHGR